MAGALGGPPQAVSAVAIERRGLDKKIDTVAVGLDKKIDAVDKKIDTVATALGAKIDAVAKDVSFLAGRQAERDRG